MARGNPNGLEGGGWRVEAGGWRVEGTMTMKPARKNAICTLRHCCTSVDFMLRFVSLPRPSVASILRSSFSQRRAVPIPPLTHTLRSPPCTNLSHALQAWQASPWRVTNSACPTTPPSRLSKATALALTFGRCRMQPAAACCGFVASAPFTLQMQI
jgi:hypothetical protein